MAITAQEAKLKPGYKQSEVGVIPEDWEVKPLKQLSPRQCVGVVVNPSSYFNDEGTVPFLVGSNVEENSINWRTAKRISDASNQILGTTRLAAGDLVTVRVGEPGLTAVIPPELDGCNCASMMIVRKHPSFDSHWLCWVMNSRIGRLQVDHVQYGTAQKQFNISDAVDFCYPVPPLPEQRAIAAALSDVDALIMSLDRLIAKKRDIKQATMQQLLTGKTRLPGFSGELKPSYKQTEAGVIPEDWEVHTLGDEVNQLEAGVSVNSVDEEFHIYAHEQAILKTSAVLNGYFLPHESKKIASRDIKRAKLNPRADSIIISRMNTPDLVGECGYVDKDYPTLFLPDRLWMTRFKRESKINVKWLSYLLSYRGYKVKIKQAATGTSGSMKNISKDSLLSINIPFPTPEEQQAIATVLSDMEAEIAALEQKRDKTRALKLGMMQELLTGKTRLV